MSFDTTQWPEGPSQAPVPGELPLPDLGLDALQRHLARTGLQVVSARSWGVSLQTLADHPLGLGYRFRGGVIRDDLLVDALRDLPGFRIAHLARLIVDRRLVHCNVAGFYWFPAFQLKPSDALVNRALTRVLRTLNDAFDSLEVLQWFATPNEWLGGGVPADELARRPEAVIQAARTDRSIATGWC